MIQYPPPSMVRIHTDTAGNYVLLPGAQQGLKTLELLCRQITDSYPHDVVQLHSTMKTRPLWSSQEPLEDTGARAVTFCAPDHVTSFSWAPKKHENLTGLLFCFGIFLWLSLKNLNSKLTIIWARILLEKDWYDMYSVFYYTGGKDYCPCVHPKMYYAPSSYINYTA